MALRRPRRVAPALTTSSENDHLLVPANKQAQPPRRPAPTQPGLSNCYRTPAQLIMWCMATTRTIGPLHFEDLDPKRFEDLVRQLAYPIRSTVETQQTRTFWRRGGEYMINASQAPRCEWIGDAQS